jgi:hypothetical protein
MRSPILLAFQQTPNSPLKKRIVFQLVKRKNPVSSRKNDAYLCWPLASSAVLVNIFGCIDLINEVEQINKSNTISKDGKSKRALIAHKR